jgi:hypothetical protein
MERDFTWSEVFISLLVLLIIVLALTAPSGCNSAPVADHMPAKLKQLDLNKDQKIDESEWQAYADAYIMQLTDGIDPNKLDAKEMREINILAKAHLKELQAAALVEYADPTISQIISAVGIPIASLFGFGGLATYAFQKYKTVYGALTNVIRAIDYMDQDDYDAAVSPHLKQNLDGRDTQVIKKIKNSL